MITNTENQALSFEKKIEIFSKRSYEIRKAGGTCPVQDLLAPSVEKWSLFCIYNLAYNKKLRFGQLKNYIPKISSRMLSVTLKKLEHNNMVKRKVYAEVPPKVEYSLTEFGHEYAKRLIDLNLWLIENNPQTMKS